MKVSLSGQTVLLPSPVCIVGTYGPGDKPNIMNAAWGGIVCSQPPCISVSLREATLSYHNIKRNQAFTVNIPSEQYFKEADLVGIISGRDFDKFEQTGLTPEKSKLVNAPIVKEFPYALECKLLQQIALGTHTLFIGEIVGIVADSEVLSPNQLPDIEKVRPLLWGSFGSPGYYKVGDKLGKAFSVGKEILKS